jgi:D-alanyl-D-alanine-carboxypeptidase/D-alanyl-D-alanine-endopeptidase
MPYPQLLRDEITGPLQMNDTAITLTPSMKARLIQGYNPEGQARPTCMGALTGAGGIRSTAADLLTYLDAQLHPNLGWPETLGGRLRSLRKSRPVN